MLIIIALFPSYVNVQNATQELPPAPLAVLPLCMNSLWFPLSRALSALLAQTITPELNIHLTQRAELLMRWPRGLTKPRGSSVNKPAFRWLLCLFVQTRNYSRSLVIAAAHVMLFYITGGVWCKWATGTKGKNLQHPYLLFYLFLFVSPSPLLLLLSLLLWSFGISTMMSHLL